jgi:hypothetical protein
MSSFGRFRQKSRPEFFEDKALQYFRSELTDPIGSSLNIILKRLLWRLYWAV